jgi:hypothetical protein
VPRPLALWNPTRSLWETERFDLLSEHSVPFLETWPTSGSMRSGSAFARPTSAPRITGSGSSSRRSLKTPTANLGSGSGSHHPVLRKQGGHGPTLADEVEHTIPGLERDQPSLANLPSAVLPTPNASNVNDGEDVENWLGRRERIRAKGINGNGMGMPLSIAAQILGTGGPTPPPSDAGSDDSDE